MPTDAQLRGNFIQYYRQLKLTWLVDRETDVSIIKIILGHKGSELITYIACFKKLIFNMTNNIAVFPDKYSKNHPVDGRCVDLFIGASINTNNYTSNYALRLYFSSSQKRIYKFEVLC